MLDWIGQVRIEHGPKALDGPYPVRVGDEEGVLLGVQPGPIPSHWDDLEPDAWPIPKVHDRFDDRRVDRLIRGLDFAAPVGVSTQDHRDQTLLDVRAHRWFRGVLVPTVAGLVALSDRPERCLPGCAYAIRLPGTSDRVLSGSLPWLAERVTEERAIWSGIPRDVARLLVVLALAERAWVGPDARTPITLSREDGRVRFAIPTAPANALEREDRAPGNPHLRQLLVRVGEFPRIQGDGSPRQRRSDELDGRATSRRPV